MGTFLRRGGGWSPGCQSRDRDSRLRDGGGRERREEECCSERRSKDRSHAHPPPARVPRPAPRHGAAARATESTRRAPNPPPRRAARRHPHGACASCRGAHGMSRVSATRPGRPPSRAHGGLRPGAPHQPHHYASRHRLNRLPAPLLRVDPSPPPRRRPPSERGQAGGLRGVTRRRFKCPAQQRPELRLFRINGIRGLAVLARAVLFQSYPAERQRS